MMRKSSGFCPKSHPELQITDAFDLVFNADLCWVLTTAVPQKKGGSRRLSARWCVYSNNQVHPG